MGQKEASKIFKNIRFSSEFLNIITDFSNIIRDEIAGSRKELSVFNKLYKLSGLIERLSVRGFPFYFDNALNICERYSLLGTKSNIGDLRSRLDTYVMNITQYNRTSADGKKKENSTAIKTVYLDEDLRDIFDRLSNASSVAMGMDITFSDVFKSSILYGVSYVFEETRTKAERICRERGYNIQFDFDIMDEQIEARINKMNDAEYLFISFGSKEFIKKPIKLEEKDKRTVKKNKENDLEK